MNEFPIKSQNTHTHHTHTHTHVGRNNLRKKVNIRRNSFKNKKENGTHPVYK